MPTNQQKLIAALPEMTSGGPIAQDPQVRPLSAARPSPMDPWDLLVVLAGAKRLILGVTLTIALTAAAFSLWLPNRYTATAIIMPPQQTQSLAGALMNQLAGISALGGMAQKDLGLKNPADIYVSMLKSRGVAEAMIQKFDLQHIYRQKELSDARRELEQNSDISASKDSLITISVEDRERHRAAALANAYIDELTRLTQRLAVTEAAQRRLFFEEQLQEAKKNLANAEESLEQTQHQTGVIQLQGQAKVLIESVAEMRAQIAAKEVQLQSVRAFATEQNPEVIVLQQQLAELHRQLGAIEQQSSGDDLQVATSKAPEAVLEYIRKLRDLKFCEAIYELLTKQYEAAKLDEAKSAAVIQVVDAATEPDRKSGPQRTMIVLLSAVMGLLSACTWVLLQHALRQARRDPVRAQQMISLRGSITQW